jgi:hypothetical protein
VPSLSLDYAFRPNPVRTSQVGIERKIDLEILISAPSWLVGPLTQIEIAIPTGDDSGGSLQEAAQLTTPAQPHDPNWKVSVVQDSTVRLTTTDGTAQAIDSLVLTVPGVVVNDEPGTVDVAITETGDVAADGVRRITKWDEVVLAQNLRCDPPRTTGPYQPATLRWDASQAGKGHTYKLLSIDDGRIVQTGTLDPASQPGAPITPPGTTKYALEIAGGGKSAQQTLTATATVLEPKIRSAVPDRYLGGRVLALHWLAENALRCAVLVDDTVIDSAAPTDTWQDGYLLVTAAGTHTYQVFAYGLDGKSEQDGARQTERAADPLVLVRPGGWGLAFDATAFGAASDASLALNAAQSPPLVGSVDVNGTARSVLLGQGAPTDVALMPDKSRALVALNEVPGRALAMVDLVQGTVGPLLQVAATAGTISGMALVPPGARALVTTGSELALVDVAAWKVIQTFAGGGGIPNARSRVAVSADGKLALSLGAGGLLLQSLNGGGATTLPLDADKCTPAVTSDGTRALVVTRPTGGVATTARLVDLASRTFATDPLALGTARGSAFLAAAFLPGNSLAIAGDDDGLHVIDVPRWRTLGTIKTPSATNYGVMATGSTTLVAGDDLYVYRTP